MLDVAPGAKLGEDVVLLGLPLLGNQKPDVAADYLVGRVAEHALLRSRSSS